MNDTAASFSHAAAQARRSPTGLEIAVVGMSLRFPGAKSPDEFWGNLRDGVESVTRFSRDELEAAGVPGALLDRHNYVPSRPVLADVDQFAAEFFGINPREAEVMDPQQRLFLESAWEALEAAGYNPATCSEPIGVFCGSDQNDYWQRHLVTNPDFVESIGDFGIMVGSEKDYLPTQVCYRLDLHGPGVNVQTACSTSLVAVHLACQSLLSGECSMALAGGVTVQIPGNTGYLCQEGMIFSPDGHCRAFDAAAQGTAFGSGLGVVVLKRLADALRDRDEIHAVVLGSAINNDGARKVGFTAPSVDGQAAVISSALAVAGVPPDAISYVEAHGTGTALGDPVEIEALKQAFASAAPASQWCAIGSAKTNFGHLGAAAGIAGFIKAVLALRHGQLPPSLHFKQPNPKIDFLHSPFYVQTVLADWPGNGSPRRAGVSSFGIGGTNAHVVLEEPPRAPTGPSVRPWQLLTLSARTPTALAAASANLTSWLRRNPTPDLADAAFTLALGRKSFPCKLAVTAADATAAAQTLETAARQERPGAAASAADRAIAFLFPGQGTQFANMGRGLYRAEPVFAREVDRCCKLLEPHLGFDLRRLLYPEPSAVDEANAQLERTINTQPALFVVEHALAGLWASWGIRPSAMIGHSIGEYVAATLAGVFSLEDALALVAFRGRLMDELPGGAMLAVTAPERTLAPLLDGKVALAAVNRPELCVVSGRADEVERLRSRLKLNGIECQQLRTSHAFHSEMMDPILARFTERVARATLESPRIAFISNVTGTWITPAEATDPSYWARHLRSTVRFADGMRLLSGSSSIPVEVGPGRSLSAGANGFASLPRVNEQDADVRHILDVLGKLWSMDVAIDWPGFYAHENRRRIALPTYPFERRRYWIEPGTVTGGAASTREAPARSTESRDVRAAEATTVPQSRTSSSTRPAGLEYVEPTDDVELKLVEIWENLLGISPVGIRDDFFELGGHSLLAVSLMSRIEATFGQVLSTGVLLEEGATIEGLASLLHEAQVSKRETSLVTLQSQGAGLPFFCVHAVGGTVFSYTKLSQQMGTAQPFYGLQSRGHTGRAPHLTIEEMATYYISSLKDVQAEGPYRVGGWSMGGLVAFEMARQLAELGEKVEQLILIDSWLIEPDRIQVVVDESTLLQLFANDIAAVFGQRLDASEQEAMRGLDSEAVFERLFARINALNELSSDGLDYIRTLFRVFAANTQAVGAYRPAPITQETLLISAAERAPSLIQAVALQGGDVDKLPLQGWPPVLGERLRCVTVPGNHYSLLSEPNVQEVARQVRNALERSLVAA